MTVLKIARDKGRLAAMALSWPELPLAKGEAYEYVAANDLGRIEQYIGLLEDVNRALLAVIERAEP